MKKTKSTTQINPQRKEEFGMKKDQIKTATNEQAAQEQVCCCIDTMELMFSMAVTADYLDSLDKDNLPEPEDAGSELLQKTIAAAIACNKILSEEGMDPLDIPNRLNTYQIAQLILALYHVVQIPMSEIASDEEVMGSDVEGDDYPKREYVILYYQEKCGPSRFEELTAGSYTPFWELLIADVCPTVRNIYELAKEVYFWLHIFAKKTSLYHGQELLLLINGIFNCKTKELMPFSPDYVFTSKCPWEYVEREAGPVLQRSGGGNPLTADEWIKEFKTALKAKNRKNSKRR